MHPFAIAILVHSLNRFPLCTKMATGAVAKLLLCCDIICKRSIGCVLSMCAQHDSGSAGIRLYPLISCHIHFQAVKIGWSILSTSPSRLDLIFITHNNTFLAPPAPSKGGVNIMLWLQALAQRPKKHQTPPTPKYSPTRHGREELPHPGMGEKSRPTPAWERRAAPPRHGREEPPHPAWERRAAPPRKSRKNVVRLAREPQCLPTSSPSTTTSLYRGLQVGCHLQRIAN